MREMGGHANNKSKDFDVMDFNGVALKF